MECLFFSWKGKLMYTHEYTMPSINIKYYSWCGDTVLYCCWTIPHSSSELKHQCMLDMQNDFCVYSLCSCRNWSIILQFSVCFCNTVSLKLLTYETFKAWKHYLHSREPKHNTVFQFLTLRILRRVYNILQIFIKFSLTVNYIMWAWPSGMQSKCIAMWVSWLSFISHTVTLQTLRSLLQRVPVTFCSKNRTYVISWRLNLFLWSGWESYMPFLSCWRTYSYIWGFIRRKRVHCKHCLAC